MRRERYIQPGVSGGQTGGFDHFQVELRISVGRVLTRVPARGESSCRSLLVCPGPYQASTAGRWRPAGLPNLPGDLGGLGLDNRTLRALEEALFIAFRGSVPLAVAVLCGTIIEGAIRTLAPLLDGVAEKPSELRPQWLTMSKRLAVTLSSSKYEQLSARTV